MIPVVAGHRTRSLTSAVAGVAVALATQGACATDIDTQLVGTPADTASARPGADAMLATMLPQRSDRAVDWYAPLEPLHRCGEPRLLPTCVPPPPCHPALPPRPLDLVGMAGAPTCGPIYRGPCAPRTGTHDDGPHPRIHRVHDRLFDWFYAPRTPILP